MSGSPPNPEPPDLGRRLIWSLGGLLVLGIVLVAVTLMGDGGGGAELPSTTSSTTLAAGDTTTASTIASSTTSGSTSTTTATTTAPTTSSTGTTLADPLAALVLAGHGIGSLGFGVEADRAIAELNEVIGPSDDDSDWVDSFSTFGTCPGTEARLVRWSSLQAFFTNGETEWASEGIRHFFHYSQSVAAGAGDVLTLSTAKGIGLGATIAELKDAYGSDVSFTEDPLFDLLWEVSSGEGVLWGSATSGEDDGLITVINGGFGCGE